MLSNSITKMAKSLTDLMKLRREVQGTREGFDVSALTLYLECICRNNGCSVTVSLRVKQIIEDVEVPSHFLRTRKIAYAS